MKFLDKKWFIRPYNNEYEILYLGDDDILHAADIVPYGAESMSLELARHLVKIQNNYLESLHKGIEMVNVCGNCGNIDDEEDEFCSSCRRAYREEDYRNELGDYNLPKSRGEIESSIGDSFEIDFDTGESRTVKTLELKVGNEYELNDGRIVKLRSEAGCGNKRQLWGKVANSVEEMWFDCYGEYLEDESIRIVKQVTQANLDLKVGQIWETSNGKFVMIEKKDTNQATGDEMFFGRFGNSLTGYWFEPDGSSVSRAGKFTICNLVKLIRNS